MNRSKSLLSGVVTALVMLGSFETAHAQTITVAPATVTDPSHPLTFNNVPLGAISQPQYIAVAASALTTIVVTTDTSWLVFPNGPIYHAGTNAISIPVAVTAAGLTEGAYTGSFDISVSQFITATVYVSMTVNGTAALAAYPSMLFFSAQQDALSAVPANTVVTITSSGLPLGYTLSTQVQAGDPNWLALNATTGISGYGGFLVQVIPFNLSVGSHFGSITAFSTSSNDSVTINVTLMVYANSLLSVTPAAPPLIVWQLGTNDPPAQQFTVSTTGGTVPFTARLSPLVSWAVLSPFSSSAALFAPATLTVTPTPNAFGLAPGTHTTYLIVTPLGGPDLPAVPITLIATPNPFLQLSTTTLSFTAQFGSAQAPPDQPITIASSGFGSVGFTVISDSPWLTVRASFPITPSTLLVHVNPVGLPAGMVTGNLTILPTNGSNFPQTVSVTLMMVSSSQISVGASQLLFSYQTGFPQPSTQTVQVRSSGDPVLFSVSTATGSCGSGWLSAVASSYTTPATLAVSVLTPGFVPVSCQGIVTLNYNSGSGPASVVIYVTVAVSGNSELVVSLPAGFGDESAQQGAAPYTRQIALNSTDSHAPVSFSASAFNLSGGSWLSLVGVATGFTPQTLTLRVNPSAVPGPGFYSGNLVISSPSLANGFISIPITLRVISAVTVSVSSTSLSFSQAQGGPAPSAQIFSLTSSGASTTFNATIAQINGGNWLRITPTGGQANGYIQASVLSNSLPQGDYPAQILLTFQNATPASITVYVTLHVGPPLQTVNVSEPWLRFSYQIGGPQPVGQKITVTGTGGAVDFTVGFNSSGWLSTDLTKGTTPEDVNVLVNTLGLSAANSPYSGTISIGAPGVLANPILINVILTVTGVPTPVPTTVASNASGAYGAISAGELITIKGTSLASVAALFHVNPQDNVDSNLAGVRVLFSNIPGTPIYVSPEQINVIVPYEIEGFISTAMVVENQGIPSVAIPLTVIDCAPGLYTNNFAGTGQVTAVNEDGTLNGPAGGGFSPAPQGSVLTVYATGFGQSSPHSITGSVTPMPHNATDLLWMKETVTATIGGRPADLLFAGAAPGIVSGVVQLNLRVPAGLSGDHLTISVIAGGTSTPLTGTTVAVQ